jgi:Flp pilus assembly protein TadB
MAMAQTKRKRRTKHRGTAAGTVTTKGRTGRPPSPDERKKLTREQAREARLNVLPTWNGAIKRALLASAFMFLFLLLTSKGNILAAVVFAIFAFALYVPSGYYLELYLWRRRQRKKEALK